ncbi:DUF368 domain-containing protein [Oceanobacillus oncorhynchi]|uniref:DUF368 domain-containing protein n=1 Tax=Oceanobacillus oncorhynchi TaxID=545501 RepID=UPI0031D16F69
MTETVPGVSGSTIAMVLGIYERLLNALSMLTTKDRKKALPFLFTFGIGMACGFLASIYLIRYFLDNFYLQTFFFFIGIIAGFLPYIWKETVKTTKSGLIKKHYFIMLTSLSFVIIIIIIQFFSGMDNLDPNNLSFFNYLYFIIAGLFASTALVLPGISGALILTIMGIFEIAVDAISAFHLPIILTIGLGVFSGILITSRVVKYLLTNYISETYSAMIGLVSGSIFAILSNLETGFYTEFNVSVLITFIGGATLVVFLNVYKNRKV